MPQIDLETINSSVKTAMPLVKAGLGMTGQTNNDFAWVDKFADILDKVTQFAKVYQAQAAGQPQAQAEREPPPDYMVEINRTQPPMIPQKTQVTPPMGDNMLIKIAKFMIPVFEQYLTKCLKENPNMLIGEAISKLDILTVNEAMGLLAQYKASLK